MKRSFFDVGDGISVSTQKIAGWYDESIFFRFWDCNEQLGSCCSDYTLDRVL